ncbi:MAG: ferredoxin--NADP reductase [Flavobacteriaceae bacterium]|nr:ferredoxin--NADP reductase [Flavobacteriaceae bacterium]
MSKFHQLPIASIEKETENAVSISFQVPEELRSIFRFKAGQYLTLKTFLNGEEVRRDYSICTHPESEMLKVVVKEVLGGKFSKYANNELKAGDILEVAPPNGRFVFEADASKNRTVLAFAAGSGITPVIGIVKTVLIEEPQSKIVLLYGNKTPKDTIFLDELNELSRKFEDRFQLKMIFSKANESNALFGRIESSSVNYVVNSISDKIDATYICGPEPMIHAVSETLQERGMKKEDIKYELFTPAKSTEEPKETKETEGQTQVTVLVDDEEASFNMPRNKTILEVALDHNIDAPYSCQGGICSSCVARLKSGKVEMRQNNILTDGELAEGLILTCQSEPRTSEISVDYDDV